MRVQKKLSTSTAFGLGANGQPRVELHLGSLPPNVYSKKTHRSTSLQPTILLRNDMVNIYLSFYFIFLKFLYELFCKDYLLI